MGSSMLSMDLEERTGADQISDRTFLAVLGFFVCGGLLATAFISSLTYAWKDPSIWAILAIGLVIPIIGIVVSKASNNWLTSAVGYAMVVVPFGVILGPVIAYYKAPVVIQAVAITLVVSTGMWVMGVIIPPITKNLGGYITAGLLLLIAGDLSRALMPTFGLQPVTLTLWPWVGAILFCGLIVYDINRAMQMPKTLDNAVDAAVGLYLDVINLFLRILQIMGGKKSD